MTITASLRRRHPSRTTLKIRPGTTFAGPVPRSTEHLEFVISPPSVPRAYKRLIEADQPPSH